MKQVGIVKEVWIYPVKSMMGESVKEADLYWYGLEGDRRYGFVQSGDFGRFPWLTARELPELVRFAPSFMDEKDRVHGDVQVLSRDGNRFPVTDPALVKHLESISGLSIRLMQLNRGMFDAAPVSLMSTATAAFLQAEYGGTLDPRRFRQNIIAEPLDHSPYIEDSWNNKTLRFGENGAEILFHRPIQRCQMVNVDPETAVRDAGVLKAVNKARDNCVGMYAWPRRTGKIRVGDPIYLMEEN